MSSAADPQAAVDGFRRGLAEGRVAHAYVVVGPPRGAGGEAAVEMVRSVFCEARPRACGTCRNCRLIGARTHPDVLWIEPEMKSRAIGIEAVREILLPGLTRTSLEGGWKAAVILGADRLQPAAANAFLKTLEEPPPRTLILMVSDVPHEMLPTLLSRCQRITVSGGESPAPEPWRSRLLGVLAAGCGGGAIGRLGAAARVAALFGEIQAAVEEEVEASSGDDPEGDVFKARVSARYLEVRRTLLQEIMTWQRDVLAVVTGLPDDALRNPGHAAALRREAQGLGYAGALDRVRRVEEMDRQFQRNLSDASVLSAFFRDLPTGT